MKDYLEQVRGHRDAQRGIAVLRDGVLHSPRVEIMERIFNQRISRYYARLTRRQRRDVEHVTALTAEYAAIMEAAANESAEDFYNFEKHIRRLRYISGQMTRFVVRRETRETAVMNKQRELSNRLRKRMQHYCLGAAQFDADFAFAQLPQLVEEQNAYNDYVAMHGRLYERIQHILEQDEMTQDQNETRLYHVLGRLRGRRDEKTARKHADEEERRREQQKERQRRQEEKQRAAEEKRRQEESAQEYLMGVLAEELEDAS